MRLPANFATIKQIFAIRNYRFYIAGIGTSNIGAWIQRVAIGWLTWELTESSAWVGGIAIAEVTPMLILGLIAGTVVDRMDYLKLLRRVQAVSVFYSVLLATFTLSGLMNIWILLAITLLRGSNMAFQRPSRMNLVYSVVGRDLLPSGLAINSMVFNGSRFVGPAIGGAIIATAGIGWAFATAATLFLVFTLALRAIKFEEAQRVRSGNSFAAETWEGITYIVRHPGIRMQMVILFAVAAFARPVIDLFPAFAPKVFEGNELTLASLLSALGLGAMCGGLFLASRSGGIIGMTRVTLGAMLSATLALFAFTAVGSLWLALPVVAVLGGAFIIVGVSNQTLIQSAVDPRLRGRVISLYGTVGRAMPSVGALIIGSIAEVAGLRVPTACGAGLCLVVWAWAWRRRAAYAENMEGGPAKAPAVSAGGN